MWRWAVQETLTLRGVAMVAWIMVWFPLVGSWHLGRESATPGDDWERWRCAQRRKRNMGCLILLGAGLLLWPAKLDPGLIPGWAMLCGLAWFF